MSSERTLSQEAKRIHLENPFDAGHDRQHHQEVAESCVYIAKSEGLVEQIDLQALLDAAWWHDFERNDEEKKRRAIRSSGESLGIPKDHVEKVISIIDSHSYGEGQETLEQKILFDADKIEYVSRKRFLRVMEAVERGEMTQEVWGKYKRAWRERIPNVLNKLHFQSSKDRFAEYFIELSKLIVSDSRLEELRDIVV